MIIKRLVALLSSLFILLYAVPVQAHVIISDKDRTLGAILHVTPDDDPIAGQVTSLFLDLQDKSITPQTHVFGLTVTNEAGEKSSVLAYPEGSTVSARYTFPTQGLYTLEFWVRPFDVLAKTTTLTYSQRVSRGTAQSSETQDYLWAETGIIIAGALMIYLGVLFVGRRHVIAKQSKQEF